MLTFTAWAKAALFCPILALVVSFTGVFGDSVLFGVL